ncbi:HHL304Cp [Eremothecium sinecaudum]|uniref:triacylglycerol lipase n=1 Tax=Eremothecium sinecaudum TaxID=45286 RepID=A0A0X8HVG2_9SACH|nr:HHL304Cp [Eremothecium sinecaudum]AMD22466.1 HHL304Cp [Eremothecium sinecaudum]
MFLQLIVSILYLCIKLCYCLEPYSRELDVRPGEEEHTAMEECARVQILPNTYDKLVYFSKICALTYCIKDSTLTENKTFSDGGCPPQIEFCKNLELNPTAEHTQIELVLVADKDELGTGYVAVDHASKVVMLAFRGSSTQQDWFSNFQIHPTTYFPASFKKYQDLIKRGLIPSCDNCKVHRGFYRFAKTLSRDFLERVEKIFNLYPDYNLVVTGHSLGAALATLCGIELVLRGYHPLVLTYATPKMFNEPLRDWVDTVFESEKIHELSVKKKELKMNKGYFRVVHTQDYIPKVPPLYVAAGLEIFIGKLHFPHEIDDLEYRGIGSGLFDEVDKEVQSIRNQLNERVERWLHMYEHRSYFIMINTCSGF